MAMMRLPNSHEAYVPDSKLCDYLLSRSHPEGGPKAAFFAAAGYSLTDVEGLRSELLRIAREGTVARELIIDCGEKYVVDGELTRNNREPIPLRTVWVIDRGTTSPRLITAYPI
jgi:hypothetical protein